MGTKTTVLRQDDDATFFVPANGIFIVNAPHGDANLVWANDQSGLALEEVNWTVSQDQIPNFGVGYFINPVFQGRPQSYTNGTTDATLYFRARYNDLEITIITP